ncbi:MAG: hypothetical protein OXH75_12200 [Acidobacteria bacterium]|nr:hypothetical protein [Acidobacteriota bacterium]
MRTDRRVVRPLVIALAAVGLAGVPVEIGAWQSGAGEVAASSALGSSNGSRPERTGAQGEGSSGPEGLPTWFAWFAGRFGVHVNGASQGGVRRSTGSLGFRAYDEDARLESTHVIGGAGMIDVGGSLLLWRGLSVGAGYAQLATSDRTTVTGRVPHPLRHGTFRDLSVQELSLAHRRRVTHAFFAWRLPVAERIEASVFAGPSFYNVSQGVVSNVTVREAGGPPFETVRVDLVQTGEHTRNAVGGHVGVDVAYMPTRHAGVGFVVRYASATVDLPGARTGGLSLPVGGAEVGGGFRFRF